MEIILSKKTVELSTMALQIETLQIFFINQAAYEILICEFHCYQHQKRAMLEVDFFPLFLFRNWCLFRETLTFDARPLGN